MLDVRVSWPRDTETLPPGPVGFVATASEMLEFVEALDKVSELIAALFKTSASVMASLEVPQLTSTVDDDRLLSPS